MLQVRIGKTLILCALLGLSVLLSGCGGVSGSHSMSPASMFLPGLVQKLPESTEKGYTLETAITPLKTDATICDKTASGTEEAVNHSL